MSKILKRIENAEVVVINHMRQPKIIQVQFGKDISDYHTVPFYEGCKLGDKGDLCFVEYSKSMCFWEFHPK